jgi:hypothetical protein
MHDSSRDSMGTDIQTSGSTGFEDRLAEKASCGQAAFVTTDGAWEVSLLRISIDAR